jgi:hypothetical protein
MNRRVARALLIVGPASALPAVLLAQRLAEAYPIGAPRPASPMYLISATAIPPTGGNVSLIGSGFSPNGQWLECSAVDVGGVASNACTTTASTTASATIQCPPMAAGTYNLVCANPQGGARATGYGLLSVVSTMTCSSIGGAHLKAEHIGLHAQCGGTPCPASNPTTSCTVGQVVTSVCDETGNLNHLSNLAGPVYYAYPDTQALMPNVGGLIMGGDAGEFFYLDAAGGGFTLGDAGLGFSAMAAMAPYGMVSGGGPRWFDTTNSLTWNGSELFFSLSEGSSTWSSLNTQFGSAAASAGSGTYFTDGGGGLITYNAVSGTLLTTTLDNNLTGTKGFDAGLSTGGWFALGGSLGSSAGSDRFWGDFWHDCFFDEPLTATQQLEVAEYFNGTIGVTNPPVLSSMNPAQAATANAFSRIYGSNFQSSPTVYVVVGGVPVQLTVLAVTGTVSIDVELPAAGLPVGTYTIIIQNNDGRQQSFSNALTVQSSPITYSMIYGQALIIDLEGAFTCASAACGSVGAGNVTGWVDQSGLGNNETQSTSADQPTTYTASDSTFNGQPSVTASGSPVSLQIAANTLLQSTAATGFYHFTVVEMTSATGTQFIDQLGNATADALETVSGVPKMIANLGTVTANWGTNIGTSSAHFIVGQTSWSGSTVTAGIGVNEDTGFVTSSGTLTFSGTWASVGCLWERCQNGSSYATLKMSHYAVVSQPPTTTQLHETCEYVNPIWFGGSLTCS